MVYGTELIPEKILCPLKFGPPILMNLKLKESRDSFIECYKHP
jgi:hypothetical protein